MDLIYDVGGTSIRAAAYDPARRSLDRMQRVQTPGSVADAIEAIRALGLRVMQGEDPTGIAIGFPGPVTPAGAVLAAPTIDRSIMPVNLQAVLGPLWPNSRVLLMNDVTAAGYAYVSQGETDFAIINVGSGIGHKVFLRGEPVVGSRGWGGEIGHLVVDGAADALACDCGGRGHLGAVASGRGALALARRRAVMAPQDYRRSQAANRHPDGADLDNETLVAAYRAEDSWARSLIAEASLPLARILAAFHLTLGLERFFIVGGFALALGERYRQGLVDAARTSAWDLGQDWDAMIVQNSDDADLALLGGGYALAAGRRLTDQSPNR